MENSACLSLAVATLAVLSKTGRSVLLVDGRENATAEAAIMSDKSLTGDDEIDLAPITLALMESDFLHLYKVVRRSEAVGDKMVEYASSLAQFKVRIEQRSRSRR